MSSNHDQDPIHVLAILGKNMREAQKNYFRAAKKYAETHHPDARDWKMKYLKESKAFEREFDELINNVLSGNSKSLFDQ